MKYKVDNYRYTPNTIEEIANNYAFMHSGAFAQIMNQCKKKLTDKEKLEGYLKVTSNSGKSIYLKYMGWNGVNKNEIWLTYYNKCALNIEVGDEVTIKPTNSWSYYWHTWDTGVRLPFKIAIIAFIVSLIQSITSTITTLIF